MGEVEERVWMRRLCAGDREGLGLLFDRYHQQVYRFLRRMTGHCARSEDGLQETFLRVLRYCHAYDSAYPFKIWLFGIARNVCRDQANREGKQQQQIDSLQWVDQMADAQATRDVHKLALRQSLSKLPDKQRESLILSRYHGFSYEEIATMLSCKVSTVKGRVFWAIKNLRKAMIEAEEGCT